MSNQLNYNVSDLRQQAARMRKIRVDLLKSKASLTVDLNLLKTEWVSDSSKKFFEEYDTSWTAYIDQYCEMLGEVAKQLTWAAEQYEPLSREYARIQLGV